MKNYVYIATSLDGFIADKEETLDWLPAPTDDIDLEINFPEFIEMIDAIVMGKNTYKFVSGFGGEWPYTKPVFVVSNSIKEIPENLKEKVFLLKGPVKDIVANLHSKGFKNLYIDGGKNIQNFLQEELINELIITIIPVMLGEGIPLFSKLPNRLNYRCISSKVSNGIVQNHYTKQL
jgi:dihydrofolate reductase